MNGIAKNRKNNTQINIVTDIFARIWALWGLASFVGTFLIILIPSLLTHLSNSKKSQYIFIRISKLWMDVWLRLVLCPLKVKGLENFAPDTTYVITCNHQSLLDPTVTCPYIPGANKTIAKKSFAQVPIFGWFYRKGSVLVDRKDPRSRVKSFEDMKQVINNHMHMCIYPEGTRNKSKEPLKAFFDGAFSLAVSTNTDIMPAIITNTGKALPAHKAFYFLPHKITLEYLAPVSSKSKDVKLLKEEVYHIMEEHIKTQRIN